MDYLKKLGFVPKTYTGWKAKIIICGMEKIFASFHEARSAQSEIAELCRVNAPELIGCVIRAEEGEFYCWYYI